MLAPDVMRIRNSVEVSKYHGGVLWCNQTCLGCLAQAGLILANLGNQDWEFSQHNSVPHSLKSRSEGQCGHGRLLSLKETDPGLSCFQWPQVHTWPSCDQTSLSKDSSHI